MGIWDKLNSFADKLGVQSEGYGNQPPRSRQPNDGPPAGHGQPPYNPQDSYPNAPVDDGQYNNYGQPDPNAYTNQETYNEPTQPNTYYEPTSSGGSYVSAGVRPKNAPRERASWWNNLRSRLATIREDPPMEDPYAANPPPQNPNLRVISGDAGPQAPVYGGSVPPNTTGPYANVNQTHANEEPDAPVQSARHTTTMIYLVRHLQDAEDIIGHMMDGENVIINLEEIDEVLKQRVLDMVSGAAFARECSIRRISFRNYLIAPSGEKIDSNVYARDQGMPPDDGYYSARDSRERRY